MVLRPETRVTNKRALNFLGDLATIFRRVYKIDKPLSPHLTMAFITLPLTLSTNTALRTSSFRGQVSQTRPGIQVANATRVAHAHGAAEVAMSTGSLRKRDGPKLRGPVFKVGDNIDTDQIIPAEYLTLVPSNPDEYVKLGSFAMCGLPAERYRVPFIKDGEMSTQYPIIVAGDNFGCGSSREHAPVAIGAAGGCAVIAESFARIFFRNCSATGELYPWECEKPIVDFFTTGDIAEIDFDDATVTNVTTGEQFKLKPLGDVLPVIDAGGIFEFARQSGMIAQKE